MTRPGYRTPKKKTRWPRKPQPVAGPPSQSKPCFKTWLRKGDLKDKDEAAKKTHTAAKLHSEPAAKRAGKDDPASNISQSTWNLPSQPQIHDKRRTRAKGRGKARKSMHSIGLINQHTSGVTRYESSPEPTAGMTSHRRNPPTPADRSPVGCQSGSTQLQAITRGQED